MKNLILILCLILCGATLNAQIPNSSFEDWDTTGGHLRPVGWDNLNSMTDSTGVLTCFIDSPGSKGKYFLDLFSKVVPGMGIVPGFAVCGKMDPVTHYPVSGFAYAGRPEVFAGKWQYMTPGADVGFIDIILTKWNIIAGKRDTLTHTFSGRRRGDMAMSWTKFFIPLLYDMPGTSDTAMIVLSSSGVSPMATSFLWVDDLQFTDSTTFLATESLPQKHELSINPNPSSGTTILTLFATTTGTAALSISDLSGRIIYQATHNTTPGDNLIPINTQQFAPGLYLVKVITETGIEVMKLVVE